MAKPIVLLLNAANIASFPVYPYAFIQVTAVARRAGIRVACFDLLGIPRANWPAQIARWIASYRPRMILITLRNTDSMVLKDYQPAPGEEAKAYFPIEATRSLITIIRHLSSAPVVVGGFGFSLLAKELMPLLRPDLGVCGAPDAFFAHYEDILVGDYANAPNLLYFRGEEIVANERVFFPPAPEAEYTPDAIKALLSFYERFPEPGFQGAPLEIMRGCVHNCLFCSEPHVNGRVVHYRDPAAIMSDVAILAENGVTELYMISSELNPQGNDFILELADRIRAFNTRQPVDRQVSWFGANYLLAFSGAEYRRLEASGFTGGWFDISALDDDNARAMRTPYRNDPLLDHLRAYVDWQLEKAERRQEAGAGGGDGEVGQEANTPGWTMFLGNPATTMATICRTMAVANREGLATSFSSCHPIRPMRVFDYEDLPKAALAGVFSIDGGLGRVAYRQTLPSFVYPPALLDHFGSEEAVEEMFTMVGDTYLSTRYQETRDWHAFLDKEAPEMLHGMVPDTAVEAAQDAAKGRVDDFFKIFFLAHEEVLARLGLPSSYKELEQMTPYALAVSLYDRWRSEADIWRAICEKARLVAGDEQRSAALFVKAILYRLNVQLVEKYRPLFEQC